MHKDKKNLIDYVVAYGKCLEQKSQFTLILLVPLRNNRLLEILFINEPAITVMTFLIDFYHACPGCLS